MPSRPKRPCRQPGCPELVDGESGYCDRHRKAEYQRQDDRRGSAASRGYDSAWRKNRIWYLRQHPLCERCEAQGKVVVAILVHHRDHNPKNNTAENFESLCVPCHEEEHKAERFGRGK
jgi:5-methylcytosine-specific restriction enzyme A